MSCCNHNCDQRRKCPARYQTGWPRLDNLLNAIAYGATILFLLTLTIGLAYIIWGEK